MRFLFIGAHPDDIEFGCAGTISKLVANGHEVGCVVMSAGEGSDAKSTDTRQDDQRAVWEYLGVHYNVFLGFPDGFMRADKRMVGQLSQVIAKYAPDAVLTHYTRDRHQDHRATAEAVVSACGTRWNLAFFDSFSSEHFAPDVFVDIGEFTDRKDTAISMFRSEVDKFKARGVEFAEVALCRNLAYGLDNGKLYAEGYKIARYVLD